MTLKPRRLKIQATVTAATAFTVALLAACSAGSPDSTPNQPESGPHNELEIFKVQEGWLPSAQQLGHIVSQEKGFYEEVGLQVERTPGGPNASGIPQVVSGTHDLGVVNSSPLLMTAAAEGIPVAAIATELQEHPGALISKPDNPVLTPEDLIGKKVGAQATSEVHIRALLATNNLSWEDIEYVAIGSDFIPLVSGQVEAAWGFVTNESQLMPLEGQYEIMRLWDQGIQYYANVFYANKDNIANKPEVYEAFLSATEKGWAWARDNPEEAIALLIAENPELDADAEARALDTFLDLMYTDATDQAGWGAMTEENWQRQIQLFDEIGEFGSRDVPEVSDFVVFDLQRAALSKTS